MYQTGNILLVSSKGVLPRAIQWFQGNKWSHAGTFLIIEGHIFICEALKRGIALTPFCDYKRKHISRKCDLLVLSPKEKLTNEEKEQLTVLALRSCGNVPYEYINLLFYQPIKYITKRINDLYKKAFKKNLFKNGFVWIGGETDKRFICGEWVAYLWNSIRGYFPDWSEVAPVDLFNSDKFKK